MLSALRVQNLGSYILGDRLGVGGMAEVFAADSPQFGRVAIKRILPGLLEDQEFSDMFWDEARITSRLDHPNIVKILDYGRIDSQLYMALEYVDGPTMARVLRKAAKIKRALSYAALLSLIVELLDALSFVHEARDDRGRTMGIVHRDVSPGNVMITSAGRAKLGDFGIVRCQAVARRTQPGELKGKIGYMSPEQATGETVAAQSDLFSAGIILAEFLTLRPLFLGRTEMQTLSRTVHVDLTTWHRYNQNVPLALRAVVEKALSRDLSERYQSAAQMRDELVEVAEQYGWALSPEAVVKELHALELIQRDAGVSGERLILTTVPPPIEVMIATASNGPPELPTLIPPLGGPTDRPEGRPVWNVGFNSSTLTTQLFLALRRAWDGTIELSSEGHLLSLELGGGRILSSHDSTGVHPLGRLLQEESVISPEQLVRAIGESRRAGLRLGEHLVLQGKLRSTALQRLLGVQLRRRLSSWVTRDSGRLAVYQVGKVRGWDDEQYPSSYAEIVAAMRPSMDLPALERALAPVMDAVVLPSGNLSVEAFGLTHPEVRALLTAMDGGAFEGSSVRSLVEQVVSERIAGRRDTLFALLVGLSGGLIQAPGFGR